MVELRVPPIPPVERSGSTFLQTPPAVKSPASLRTWYRLVVHSSCNPPEPLLCSTQVPLCVKRSGQQHQLRVCLDRRYSPIYGNFNGDGNDKPWFSIDFPWVWGIRFSDPDHHPTLGAPPDQWWGWTDKSAQGLRCFQWHLGSGWWSEQRLPPTKPTDGICT